MHLLQKINFFYKIAQDNLFSEKSVDKVLETFTPLSDEGEATKPQRKKNLHTEHTLEQPGYEKIFDKKTLVDVAPQKNEGDFVLLDPYGKKSLTKSNLQNIIKKYNIRGKPVGQGSFSIVFSDGRVATKISPNKEDAMWLWHLDQLKESAPPEIAQHFPEVYDVDYDKTYGVYITTLEHLVRVHRTIPEISTFLESSTLTDELKSKIKILIKNEQFLKKIYKEFSTPTLDKIMDEVIRRLSFISIPHEAQLNGFLSVYLFFKQYLDPIIELAYKNYSLAEENPLPLTTEVKETFIQNLSKKLTTVTLPTQAKEYKKEKEMQSVKEVGSLAKAFEYLREKGINYHDMRKPNIMMRPSTKELVISDPGLFTSR